MATKAMIATKLIINSGVKALTKLKAHNKTMSITITTATIHKALASMLIHLQKEKRENVVGDVVICPKFFGKLAIQFFPIVVFELAF
jgi:hypothetical protein